MIGMIVNVSLYVKLIMMLRKNINFNFFSAESSDTEACYVMTFVIVVYIASFEK